MLGKQARIYVFCNRRQQGVDWSYSLIRLLQQLMYTDHWSDIMKRYLREAVGSKIGVSCALISVDAYYVGCNKVVIVLDILVIITMVFATIILYFLFLS